MNNWTKKKSNLLIYFILLMTIFAGIIENEVTKNNVIGGAIVLLILVLIPLVIEIIRNRDPITYYGLDFSKLKEINLKLILIIAILTFFVVASIDYFVFDLLNKIINSNAEIGVGNISFELAKSNLIYLSVIFVFSGTFLEELWFRGVIQYKVNTINFLKKINPHFAIFLQSFLFGLVHFIPIYYGTTFQYSLKIWFFIYPMTIGLIIGYTNEKYKSLYPGWIIHFTNNILSIILFALLIRL